MSAYDSPIPLSEIESVLAWVDTFKLSRPTKKISRDFSDAVLLAEILCVHYPKLVEMHNYPPRNSHSLKLNNWMTLNRKVLKKLKLNLCCNTMEQLANCAPGVIERVLVMVRDKIRRDEDLNKSVRDAEQNVSSGGSYYEACGDEEHVLVVPLKTRVNGVLETIQQKVVSYDSYQVLKEDLKDAKESVEVLKQKVDHLDSLLKLKEERIEELQKQLDRKQTRRKDVENYQNSLAVPFEPLSPISNPIVQEVANEVINMPVKVPSLKAIETVSKIPKFEPLSPTSNPVSVQEAPKEVIIIPVKTPSIKTIESQSKIPKFEESKIPVSKVSTESNIKTFSKPSNTEVITDAIEANYTVEKIKSDVFKEIEIIEDKSDVYAEIEEFKDSEQEGVTTIADTIQKEIVNITIPLGFMADMRTVSDNNKC